MDLGTRSRCELDGLDIAYDDRVLTPRPWTVLQGRWAADLAATAPPGRLLELFAGVGHIGLVAAAASGRALVQVDLDPVACGFARRNAEVAGLGHRVEVRCAPVDDAVAPGERFPLVLADPPYLRPEDLDRFPDDPRHAVDGGEDGVELAAAALDVAAGCLLPGGALLAQLGGRDQLPPLLGAAPGWRVDGVRDDGPARVVALLRRAR